MGVRNVQLDDEAEKALNEVVQATGLSVSSALKQGLLALRHQISGPAGQSPYEIYSRLDLGPGGYAIGPSSEVGQSVRNAIRKKLEW